MIGGLSLQLRKKGAIKLAQDYSKLSVRRATRQRGCGSL